MMAIVQVLWYEKFQHLPYFKGMAQYASHECLLSWSGHIYQAFITLNAFALPGSVIQVGNSFPENVQCLAATFHEVNTDLSCMRNVITNLSASSDRQDRNISSISEQTAIVTATQKQILSIVETLSVLALSY